MCDPMCYYFVKFQDLSLSRVLILVDFCIRPREFHVVDIHKQEYTFNIVHYSGTVFVLSFRLS